MAERGTRTRIIFGGVSAEVSLLKLSGKPVEAKHDTRRVLVDEAAPTAPVSLADPLGAAATGLEAGSWGGEGLSIQVGPDQINPSATAQPAPVGVPVPAPVDAASGRETVTGQKVQAPAVAAPPSSPTPAPAETYVLPETVVQQGLWLGEGDDAQWVDLTDRLAEIDERTALDGMEIMGTIPSPSVPRLRVRDAYYIAAVDRKQRKVLRLIHGALNASKRAAVVRWSPRSSHQLGIVVATGDALAVLSVEWAENMREPSDRVTDSLKADVSVEEAAAALRLVEAWAMPASALDDLRDERLRKRAELLVAARVGRLDEFEPPPTKAAPVGDLDLVASLEAAAASR